MPFKKNHLQNVKKLEHFIGRDAEIAFFIHNILTPEAPTHNILSISGQGGVGKSTLLTRFINEAHLESFKEYCLTAVVDERQATPIAMMEKFAQQLHITGKFEKVLKSYKEAVRRQQTKREILHDVFSQNVPDVAGAVVEGIPVAGPLLREGAKLAAIHLLQAYQTSNEQKDTELLEIPIDELTKTFVTELNHLADTTITLSSIGKKHQRRVILFFDTFEQLAAEATPWLLDLFLDAQISGNVVLVIAGRDPIEYASSEYLKRWLPYCNDGIIYWIALDSFTEDETRMYLMNRGITNVQQISTIWQLSRGLPLYLGLLTSNPQGEIDPTKDVVVNFLRWLPEQEYIKQQLALDAALLFRSFNQDDLEVFSYVPAPDQISLYQWLINQPFVRIRAQDGRYLYHDVVRDLFSRHLYQHSQRHYYEIRRALATYYQECLEKIQAERGDEVYDSLEEWLELLLAAVYQLLLLPDPTNHSRAIVLILNAYEGHTRPEQEREIAELLRTISQDLPSNIIHSHARRTAAQLLSYMEAAQGSQEMLDAVTSLSGQVLKLAETSLPREVRLALYRKRSETYWRRSDQSHADEDLQQVINLTDTTSCAERTMLGKLYLTRSDKVQEALTEFNHAIELDPKAIDPYEFRGWTYCRFYKAQEALEDFRRVLELSPHREDVYKGIGRAYLFLKEYQKAIEALNTNTNPGTATSRDLGDAHFSLHEYQKALAYYNRAINGDLKFNPSVSKSSASISKNAFISGLTYLYNQRGYTYLWLKDIDQARTDFTQSYKMKPTLIHSALMAEWIGICREPANPNILQQCAEVLGEVIIDPDWYVESVKDSNVIKGAVELLEIVGGVNLQSYTLHICQGIVLLLHKNFIGAFAEIEQGLHLNPNGWDTWFWKGVACAFLERDEEAIAAIEKAVDLELPPILLAPLHWFERERSDFYGKYVVPLLAKHV